MSERLPDNLAMLYEHFGQDQIEHILPGESFEVDGVEFVCEYAPNSTPERFSIVKPMPLVERYRSLCDAARGGNIVELGIAEGGSTALLALWAEPRKLVAVDLEPNRLDALDDFIEARGLGDRVSAHYGVDQADRDRLVALVDEEFDGAALDLVIDDASHHYAPTRVSFGALFPHLRPGGVYIIEDWDADVFMADAVARAMADPSSPHHERVKESLRASMAAAKDGPPPRPKRTPLARLALELVIACASAGDAVAEVAMNRSFIAVTRGEGELGPDTTLDSLYKDRFGFLGPGD